MIEVEHLSKWYGPRLAVDDISFQVSQGEIVGFLGPNGAGKSTTLRILAGFLGATSGRVRIAGHDIGDEAMQARSKLGYMPETSPLYPEMRVSEYLAFRAELKLVPRRTRRDAVERAMRDAGVDDVAGTPIGQLSKGYRQRVGLADALVSDPPLLILDEPTAGLDPNQIREVRALVQRLGRDRTVLLSTHILSEVEATCTRALVIARGRLVAEGTIDEIRALRRSSGVSILARGPVDRALAAARQVAGVQSAAEARDEAGAEDAGADLSRLAIELAPGAEAGPVTEEICRALVGAGVGVRAIAPRTASLEQVFSALTAGELEAPAPPADRADRAALTSERSAGKAAAGSGKKKKVRR